MTRYEVFKKEGNRYSRTPCYTNNKPNDVFITLSRFLTDKCFHDSSYTGIRKMIKRRCPYCGHFNEIIIFHEMPNGDRSKIVFTVPN